VTNPAFGVGNISLSSGDQVDVTMKNALPCNGTRVYSNVETFHGSVFGENTLSDGLQQFVAGGQFLFRKVEIVAYMSPGDNKGVQFRHREHVPDGKGQFVLSDIALFVYVAEKARSVTLHPSKFLSP